MCVVGASASSFAAQIAEPLRARGADVRTLRVELRHAEGASVEGERDAVLRCHPEALARELAALAPQNDGAITIGSGAALPVAVKPDLLVWISGGESVLGVDPALRALAGEAQLVLEDPREEAARALADALLRDRT